MNSTWTDREGATVEAIAYQNSTSAAPTGLKDGMTQVQFNGEDMSDMVRSVNLSGMSFGFGDPSPASLRDQLRQWWFEKAEAEMGPTIDKAVEYGSTDLIDIGLMLARTMRRTITEEEAAELGVFFYLIGKIARWQSAIERGERPSDDTLLDIGVYVRMAQRIRDAGGWPGTKETRWDSGATISGRFEVDVVYSPGGRSELYATLECTREGCSWIAELDAPVDLAELNRRAFEHAEVCR